jgi:MFS family permease
MWQANLASQSAAWALIVARGWVVFDMTNSSTMVGAVTFAAMAPLFFVPPFAGVLADRMDRRTLLAWSYSVNLGHNLVLALLALAGMLETWHLLALALVNGTARATQMPVSAALVANLVPREKLLNALSLTAATMHGTRLIGPGLVMPMLLLMGAPGAFLLCTVFYIGGLIQILRIKTRSRGEISDQRSFAANFVAGLKYAWHHPILRMVIVMVMLHCGLTMAFESLLPTFSQQRLGAGSTGFSVIMMAVGGGALVGSLLIGGVQSSIMRGRVFLIAGVFSGLGQVLLSFAPNMSMAIVAAAVMGCTQAAYMTLVMAVTQALSEDQYRGRLASINTFSIGGVMSCMNLLNGLLGNQYTAASILLVQGVIFTIIVIGAFAIATPRQVYLNGIAIPESGAPEKILPTHGH